MAISIKEEYPGQIVTIDSAIGAVAAERFVKYTGEYPAAAGPVLGVNKYAAAIGQEQAIATSGIVRVTAGGAVNVGDALKATTTGKAIAATALAVATTFPTSATAPVKSDVEHPTFTSAVSGGILPEHICGYAVTAASTDGDIILVKLVA